MRRLLFPLAVLCCIFSCSKKEVETVVVDIPTLKQSGLYDFTSVVDFANQPLNENIPVAARYEKLAEDFKVENPTKSIYYLKRSLSIYPEKSVYLKLAGALVEAQKYEEANEIYSLLTYQQNDGTYYFGSPDEQLLHDKRMANLLAYPDYFNILYYLQEFPKEEVEALKNKWLSDERIQKGKDSVTYKMIVKVANSILKEENKGEKFHYMCQHLIKDTSTVFEYDKKNVANFDYSQYSDEMGDYEYDEDYLGNYYSFLTKEDKGSLNLNHLIAISENVVAICYAIDTSANACPKEMRHVYHRIVTYDKAGEILDSKVVAWQAGEKLATMKLENNKISITEVARKWRNSYNKYDFDNYVLESKEMGTQTFQILENGKIEQIPTL